MASLEALRAMYREARNALDYQVERSNDLDDKAARIFRFDALILTVLLTGISIAATSERLRELTTTTTVYTLLGTLTLLVVSALCSLIAYQTTELEVGLDPSDLEMAARETLDEATLYMEAIETYASRAYEVNDARLKEIATWFQVSMMSLWMGLSVLLAAAFSIVHEAAAWILLGLSAVGLIAVGGHVDLYE